MSHIGGRDIEELARGFVEILAAVGFAGLPDGQAPVVDPEAVDEVVASSSTVHELRLLAPWLDTGPAGPGCDQVWVSTVRPPWLPVGHPRPDRDHFVSPELLGHARLSPGPVSAGLHTSSSSGGYLGMWGSYVDLFSDDVLWHRPWSAWKLLTSGPPVVAQVTGAQDWTALVQQHGVAAGEFIHPDWASMTSQYDAVHVTPAAVCAIEGFALRGSSGILRPTYWSVESTLWLRWCFESVEPIADVPGFG